MIDPILIAALINAAALALATIALRRPLLDRRAEAERIEARLADLGATLEASRAARRETDIREAIADMREDVSILSNHLATLTSGQLDLKKIVDGALQRQLAGVLEEMDDAEGRAEQRLHALRERLEGLIAASAGAEAAGPEGGADPALAAALTRIEAALEALSAAAAAAPPAPPQRAPSIFDSGRVASLVAPAAMREGRA